MEYSKLAIDFAGLSMQTPIILLSGCVGFGDEYTKIEGFSHDEVGAVCLKGTTQHPRLGNALHRLSETTDGLLNAIGLQNPGVDYLVEHILPQLDCQGARTVANIAGSTEDEYQIIAEKLEDTSISAIEINISCPNVKQGGMEFGNYPEASARVVEKCRKVSSKILITKLSPNQTDIAHNARLCIEAGTDALSVINTVSGMAIDIHQRRPVLGNLCGGLSGPAIKPIALLHTHKVYQVASKHNVPVVGQGGIANGDDALEFVIAGAQAVGVGTGLFYNPLLCKEINTRILQYMQQHGFAHFSDMVGSLVVTS